MIKIRCHRVRFRSPADESSFYYFIKRIAAVLFVQGMGEDIFLHVKTPVTLAALRDLIGLFRRYNIGLDELRPLKNKKNARLFKEMSK